MTKQQYLDVLSSCGLSCEKCFAHIDGDIRKLSLQLKEKLGNFSIYAQRFETLIGDPIFKKYWIILLQKTAKVVVMSNVNSLRHVASRRATKIKN